MPDLNLVHRVRLPPDVSGPVPAIVMVHGWLGNENVMWAFASALPGRALAISMRAPVESDGGYGWMQADRVEPSGDGAGSFEQGLAALREFVIQIPRAYPVDPGRVALMGFS